MRTLYFLLSALIAFPGLAQDRCASADYLSAQKADPLYAQSILVAETFLQQKSSSLARTARTAKEEVIKIPVVVHIVYNNASQNLSDAQIRSQLDALNRDYRRANADTLNTPERFRYLAADVKVEFYLATTDPKGRGTTGIVRRYSSVATWLYNDKIKFSASNGDDAWDSKSYLNIWVGNLVSGGGYSSVPGGDASRDGIVINTPAFGAIGRGGNYSMGRATVHEAGHWLGLKHIWGDADCGDDGIADTPPQSGYTVGCPGGFRSSCGNGNTGDMYMNYMDYTADACMNLFTQEQKKKMRTCFDAGGPRASLLQSKGLQLPASDDAALPEAAISAGGGLLYPNPAGNEINLALGAERVGQTVQIFNGSGVTVQSIQISSALQKVNLSSFRAGVYFVKGEGVSLKFIKL